MRFLIIFIFLASNSFASEIADLKNLVINKELKKYDDLTFLDVDNRQVNLSDYKGNLLVLNFWATWCAPCKEEMPSLDMLQMNKDLDKLKIFPINIGKENSQKVLNFFRDLKIKNLGIYYDSPNTLAKTFQLRGIPTTIIFNKDGLEFARIVGSIDFKNKEFIEWLSSYN